MPRRAGVTRPGHHRPRPPRAGRRRRGICWSQPWVAVRPGGPTPLTAAGPAAGPRCDSGPPGRAAALSIPVIGIGNYTVGMRAPVVTGSSRDGSSKGKERAREGR
eukprot:767022-Hanusia_phi.AAC.3